MMPDLSYGATVTAGPRSMHYRYQAVKRWGEKSLPCPVCGKKVRRRKTFEATVNPFNRHEDGTPLTYAEVAEQLGAEVKEWRERPEPHQKCELPS